MQLSYFQRLINIIFYISECMKAKFPFCKKHKKINTHQKSIGLIKLPQIFHRAVESPARKTTNIKS